MGVNLFAYEYLAPLPQPFPSDFKPDGRRTRLTNKDWPVPPGGNDVLSYLDVVIRPQLDAYERLEFLASLKHRLPPGNPSTAACDQGWARFSCQARLPDRTELAALVGHLVLWVNELNQADQNALS
ncbi:MAG: hypothetical protein H6718_21150 [Polyangiaceae bacterium]|nr:hypothetical protein [Polyangiaceae bacterium]